MQSYRCHKCNYEFYQAEGDIETEIICSKCRLINYPSRKNDGTGLRGKDFQAKAIDHNCFNCLRLLFRSIGVGIIISNCSHCHRENKYNTLLMRTGKYEAQEPEEPQYKKIKESLAR